MPSYCKNRICWFVLLVTIVSISLLSCTPTTRPLSPQVRSLVLRDPVTAHTDGAALTVGTNRWSTSAAVLEEAFLPLAVTMRNTSTRPLCGGAPTAALHTVDGSSFSAVLPTSVVNRLFGPLASAEPAVLQRTANAQGGDTPPLLLLVHGSHGGHAHSGGIHGGGIHRFAPFRFHSPFYSPFHSPFYSPFYPYSWTPFAPFSRYSPYDYGYTLPPLNPNPPSAETEQPHIDQSLMREIFTEAFASRPLEPQEERTGFLFFPRPAASAQSLTLTWSWYDCVSHELMVNLSVPVAPGHS